MFGRRNTNGWLLTTLSVAALTACSGSPEQGWTAEPTSSVRQAVLDGFVADDPKYDAVGALYYEIPGIDYQDFRCSGTLIAPKVVLTARHCTQGLDSLSPGGFVPYVGFGASVDGVEQKVRVIGYSAAPSSPTHPGLLLDGGRDVAVLYLRKAPLGIEPAKLGAFDESMLGSQLEIAGFGVSSSNRTTGVKYAGVGTARAVAGKWYELLFGNKGAFLKWFADDAVSQTGTTQEANAWWDIYNLEPGYELLFGGLEGEAVNCFGDSGGPLALGSTPEDFTVYGVSFAGESSQANICDHGGAYSVLNEEMLAWVEQAVSAR